MSIKSVFAPLALCFGVGSVIGQQPGASGPGTGPHPAVFRLLRPLSFEISCNAAQEAYDTHNVIVVSAHFC